MDNFIQSLNFANDTVATVKRLPRAGSSVFQSFPGVRREAAIKGKTVVS
jgi:hypothetical protein